MGTGASVHVYRESDKSSGELLREPSPFPAQVIHQSLAHHQSPPRPVSSVPVGQEAQVEVHPYGKSISETCAPSDVAAGLSQAARMLETAQVGPHVQEPSQLALGSGAVATSGATASSQPKRGSSIGSTFQRNLRRSLTLASASFRQARTRRSRSPNGARFPELAARMVVQRQSSKSRLAKYEHLSVADEHVQEFQDLSYIEKSPTPPDELPAEDIDLQLAETNLEEAALLELALAKIQDQVRRYRFTQLPSEGGSHSPTKQEGHRSTSPIKQEGHRSTSPKQEGHHSTSPTKQEGRCSTSPKL